MLNNLGKLCSSTELTLKLAVYDTGHCLILWNKFCISKKIETDLNFTECVGFEWGRKGRRDNVF